MKARPDVNGPIGQGLLLGYDLCPLTSARGEVVPIGSCPACGSPQPLARDTPTEAASRASSRCKSCASTSPGDTRVQARSFDHLACSATSAAGGDKTGDATEGPDDYVRLASHSPTASALTARFLGVGTTTCRAATGSSPANVATRS